MTVCIRSMQNTFEVLFVSIGLSSVLPYCKRAKTNLIDTAFPCFNRVCPNERLKKVPVRVSRYFCVQSSSDSRSASRPITVITPRTIFAASIKSPLSVSTHTRARPSSHEGAPGHTAFPRFPPPSSRSRAVPAPRLPLCRMLLPH